MAEVIWTEPALADVRRIFEFIADDSPRYAAITADRILKSVDRLIDFPELGHAVPEFPDSRYRQVLMNPYRVIQRYESTADCVFILAVVHSRRDITQSDLVWPRHGDCEKRVCNSRRDTLREAVFEPYPGRRNSSLRKEKALRHARRRASCLVKSG